MHSQNHLYSAIPEAVSPQQTIRTYLEIQSEWLASFDNLISSLEDKLNGPEIRPVTSGYQGGTETNGAPPYIGLYNHVGANVNALEALYERLVLTVNRL